MTRIGGPDEEVVGYEHEVVEGHIVIIQMLLILLK
jgi:hypothetical protein